MCLIGKTQLLCMQCRGIGPHLVARGTSHGFSRVAAGTWGIFSSYDGDAHSKRESFQTNYFPLQEPCTIQVKLLLWCFNVFWHLWVRMSLCS